MADILETISDLLRKSGPLTVSEIVESTELTHGNVEFFLKTEECFALQNGRWALSQRLERAYRPQPAAQVLRYKKPRTAKAGTTPAHSQKGPHGGEAIEGSQYVTDYCAGCGSQMRALTVRMKHYCERCTESTNEELVAVVTRSHAAHATPHHSTPASERTYHGGRFQGGEW